MKTNNRFLTLCLSACIICVIALSLPGCGDGRPFDYRYTSPREVIITYKNHDYTLNMEKENNDTPFSYEFEADGDVDIVIEGKRYEIDSPYDRDKKKKKTKKKSSTKKKSNRR